GVISRSLEITCGTKLTIPLNDTGHFVLIASIQRTSLFLSVYYRRNAHGTLKGCQDTLLAAINKPEEMPDYLFRQLGFNQTWHEWKQDEQHRQQQRRPGHYRGMSM
ncbi:hypothetical protein ACO4HZ_005389, partial [Escherichia coli]